MVVSVEECDVYWLCSDVRCCSEVHAICALIELETLVIWDKYT